MWTHKIIRTKSVVYSYIINNYGHIDNCQLLQHRIIQTRTGSRLSDEILSGTYMLRFKKSREPFAVFVNSKSCGQGGPLLNVS